MKRLLAAAASALVAASAASAGEPARPLPATSVGRLPFPERGYVIDVPAKTSVGIGSVRVTENGRPVRGLRVVPLVNSGIRIGAVLAIDTSDSMAGSPSAAATSAARVFVQARPQNARVGLVGFDGGIRVLQQPTADSGTLMRVLARQPALAYGTRIYDGADEALTLLAETGVSSGSVVLLSDGADVGSSKTAAEVVSRALRLHFRIFTVGLRSATFDPAALRSLAAQTGGAYLEAAHVSELQGIYARLGRQLATEYLVDYRSGARRGSRVNVSIAVDGAGTAADSYTAPTVLAVPPYHRSLVERFVQSPASLLALSLLGGAIVAFVVRLLLARSRSTVAERAGAFLDLTRPSSRSRESRTRLDRALAESIRRRGLLDSLEREFDIAEMRIPVLRWVLATVVATAAVFALLLLVSPIVAVLALLIPFSARGHVKRRVRKVREQFGDQLPPNLQVLASALRAGHSFSGALAVVVENAHEPSQRELRRVVADEQLGVPVDDAIRRVAERMNSRDLEQVALLAELQRTTGGNAAEVLDTVVGTIRERSDIRRLVKTLTAQGRMARWILTALPIVCAGALWILQPALMQPMLGSTGGQVALVLAGFMVAVGSVLIQRIVDIEI